VFLGALANLRRVTINFVMSVRPSVRTEQLFSHQADFYENFYLKILRKTVEKIQISLKSDNNKPTLLEGIYSFYHNSLISS